MEHVEELWPGGFRLISDDRHFKLGTDSAMLAAFPALSAGCRVCDLGCGTGVLPILMSARCPDLRIDGIDIQESALSLAARNIALNGLADSVRLIRADLRNPEELPEAGSYDLAVSNPPYFPKNSGFSKAEDTIAEARDDRSCTVTEVCAAASRLVRWGGRFAVVFRPERLVDLFWAMRLHGIEPKRLRMVRHRSGGPVSLILAEGRRGGKPGLKLERDLVLLHPDGTETDEVKAIYRRKQN
ncbi:tRNA1(Val) (adenine(37)-N6)-methyltransferase [Papillibacter cinnamivorans]|uniref:tRNA1(Val) A37 N6-methylase TrmN6 n=1 Tax=Papillibacter cinnamivorans DSM 12816 TaxID=1122930 RepID=A0A1W1ZZ91_9FIRM|nr:methyltransferase [Papillibacter cinnamivorans]SMC53799.1 tRNA1(Val) A37 N6-methylase TrmN6 [Papillibacter cinnamivorans DSM 12816]